MFSHKYQTQALFAFKVGTQKLHRQETSGGACVEPPLCLDICHSRLHFFCIHFMMVVYTRRYYDGCITHS